MKLLFVHSGEKAKEDEEGNIYVGGAYSEEILQRYLDISNDLTVIFRKQKKKITKEYGQKNLEKLNLEKVKFIEYQDLNSSLLDFINIKKRIQNKKIIKNAVKNSDRIIARVPCIASDQAVSYAKKYKKTYMVEVVGCIWDALFNYNLKGKIFAIFRFLSMKKTVKKAPFAIYVTNKFLQSRYPNKYVNVGCSDVSIPNFDEKVLINRINKIKQKSDYKDISIATVAAIDVKYKNQKSVLYAIKKLVNEGYKIKYYIIGGGNPSYLLNIAKKLGIENCIEITGALPHSSVFEYLDNIDIYIQPSKQEGLPRSVIEAMSRACPIIVSNVGGNSELIENKELIFNKNNINEMINCIKKLDKEKMIQEAEKNFTKSKEYDINVLKEKRKAFYDEFKK